MYEYGGLVRLQQHVTARIIYTAAPTPCLMPDARVDHIGSEEHPEHRGCRETRRRKEGTRPKERLL